MSVLILVHMYSKSDFGSAESMNMFSSVPKVEDWLTSVEPLNQHPKSLQCSRCLNDLQPSVDSESQPAITSLHSAQHSRKRGLSAVIALPIPQCLESAALTPEFVHRAQCNGLAVGRGRRGSLRHTEQSAIRDNDRIRWTDFQPPLSRLKFVLI